jgi:CDP-diacylglycerol--glycerol-3-phosphate 3-phosphatidyltransferase
MDAWIILPATIVLFREVFVSGLREFLGARAGLLRVTKLAKWKTTVQMIALAVLFSRGIFEHFFVVQTLGMAPETVGAILRGEAEDRLGLGLKYNGMIASYYLGVGLLWLAAVLTFATGYDYFNKSRPYLSDEAPR